MATCCVGNINVIGFRVVRGPDWKYGNQDGWEGYAGTVVKWHDPEKLLVNVIWDIGSRGIYRVGHEDAFDLLVVDNPGIVHKSISCIQCSDINITGIRWHCRQCDGSICSSCFFKLEHDQTHTQFKRYTTPNTDCVDVLIDTKNSNEKIELKGLFQGAVVRRGPDWESGNENVAIDLINVGLLMETRNLAPGMVQVNWRSNNIGHYRLGAAGKVDLQLLKVASGGFYNPEHLPVCNSFVIQQNKNSDKKQKKIEEVKVTIIRQQVKKEICADQHHTAKSMDQTPTATFVQVYHFSPVQYLAHNCCFFCEKPALVQTFECGHRNNLVCYACFQNCHIRCLECPTWHNGRPTKSLISQSNMLRPALVPKSNPWTSYCETPLHSPSIRSYGISNHQLCLLCECQSWLMRVRCQHATNFLCYGCFRNIVLKCALCEPYIAGEIKVLRNSIKFRCQVCSPLQQNCPTDNLSTILSKLTLSTPLKNPL